MKILLFGIVMDRISSDCENHGMKRILHGTILFILGITIVETQFINDPPSTETACKDETVFFNWTYTTTTPALVVEWKKNGLRIALEDVGAGQSFTPVTSYAGRLNKITNAQISLGLVTPSDTGTYKCELTDLNGNPFQSNEITLTVYDVYDTPVQIQQTVMNGETILKPVSPDSSINYTWSGEGKSESGVMFTVTSSGNYTLCISGGKATCRSPSVSPCTSLVVMISACTGSFHCGFWLLLLAVVTSIIILILMWRKVKRFGFSASGFSKMKIGITGVFSFVAVGIGLGLGFGLQAGQANCLECGATIGISIALGVALSVIQFIVIINCDKEKGCDGNSKGTPASATGINLETKKKSQNKPTEKGTEASSLTAKTFGQPLPDTPNARKHQLEPLKTDSFEVENSTTEKKKKKKRKKKRETTEGNEASEEKEERQELEF